MGRKGFEPLTSRLSVECSSQAELPAQCSSGARGTVYKREHRASSAGSGDLLEAASTGIAVGKDKRTEF